MIVKNVSFDFILRCFGTGDVNLNQNMVNWTKEVLTRKLGGGGGLINNYKKNSGC